MMKLKLKGAYIMKMFLMLVVCVLVQLFSVSSALAAEAVPIILPDFSVTVNGQTIDNKYSRYPFFVYKDITYVPMTYYDSRLLGLKTSWNFQEGLIIEKNEDCFYEYFRNVVERINSKKGIAYIAEQKIMVNEKKIDNDNEEYPLLIFRDITYFPLTWRFAVNEFGWQYYFSHDEGLVINNPEIKLQNPNKHMWDFTGYVEGMAGRGNSLKISCIAPMYLRYTEKMRIGTLYSNVSDIILNPMLVSVSNMGDIQYVNNVNLECRIYKLLENQKELVYRYLLPELDGRIEWAGFAICEIDMNRWLGEDIQKGRYRIELICPDEIKCYRQNNEQISEIIMSGSKAEGQIENTEFDIIVAEV